jgi:hypothetical protein
LISIGIMVGVTAPQAAVYAAGVVAIFGFLKVWLPDAPVTISAPIEESK